MADEIIVDCAMILTSHAMILFHDSMDQTHGLNVKTSSGYETWLPSHTVAMAMTQRSVFYITSLSLSISILQQTAQTHTRNSAFMCMI